MTLPDSYHNRGH